MNYERLFRIILTTLHTTTYYTTVRAVPDYMTFLHRILSFTVLILLMTFIGQMDILLQTLVTFVPSYIPSLTSTTTNRVFTYDMCMYHDG